MRPELLHSRRAVDDCLVAPRSESVSSANITIHHHLWIHECTPLTPPQHQTKCAGVIPRLGATRSYVHAIGDEPVFFSDISEYFHCEQPTRGRDAQKLVCCTCCTDWTQVSGTQDSVWCFKNASENKNVCVRNWCFNQNFLLQNSF